MVEAPPPDPYQALGLAKDATTAQIKTAYKKAALRCHPDKALDKDAAADAFHRINQAYEILVDSEKRQKYEDQLRLYQLKREVFERKGPFSRPPPAHAPQSAGHSRGNSDDAAPRSSFFHARPSAPPPSSAYPDHIYEERRPRQPAYDDESTFSRYDAFPREGTSARKPDSGYTSTRRTPPKAPLRSDDPPRASMRQEKGTTKAKEKERRAAATKQRDQNIRKERARGFEYAPSESETDASIDDRRRPPMGSRARPRSPESDSYDEHRDKFDRARDYIQTSKDNRDDRPFPVPRGDHRREAFGTYEPSPPPRREAPEPERRASARPSLFRRGSSKAKESPAPSGRARAASYAEKKPPSSAGAARMADHPGLYHSSTTPSSSTRLNNMVNGRSGGRHSDSDEDEDFYVPKPGLKRAETLPVRPGRQGSFAGRRQSEAPQPIKTERVYSSDARGGNDDSGYSTSSPSESPSTEIPQTAPPKTQTYTYSTKKGPLNESLPRSSASEHFPGSTRDRTPRTAQSERFPGPPPMDELAGTEFRSPDFRGGSRFGTVPPATDLRSPGSRARNSPSPHSRNVSSSKHAYPAPPPSRSASFQPSRDSGRESERERDAPPSRRPSLSRSNSATKTPTSSKPPSFSRSSTGPLHINTSKLQRGGDGLLFGEQTQSPTEYHSSGPESGRERERERESSSRRRMSEDQRPGSSRTASGRPSSSRTTMDDKMTYAKRQIERSRDEKSPRSPRRMFGLA